MAASLEGPPTLLDAIPEAYIRFDHDLFCTFANRSAQEYLRRTRSDLLGHSLHDVLRNSRLEGAARRVIANGTAASVELYDSDRRKSHTATFLPDSAGGVFLRLSETPQPCPGENGPSRNPPSQGIADNLPGFVFQASYGSDGKLCLCYANERVTDVLGLERKPFETLFRRFIDCLAPEDQARFKASLQNQDPAGQWEFEGKFITPAGQEKYIRALSRSRRADGNILYDGIILDITERKRAEDALRESEDLYHQIFDVESDALVLVDQTSGSILAANAAAEELYGYTRKELLCMNRIDLSAEPEATIQATAARTPFIPLRWHRKKDGTVFPVEISGRYFEWRGRPVFVSAIRDITERRRIEEALRKSEEKFFKAYHSNPAGIIIGDQRSRKWLEVNDTFLQMLGYSRDEIVGRTWEEATLFADPDDRARAADRFFKTGSLRNFECRLRKKNGEALMALLSVDSIEIEGDLCTISSVVDITERVQLQNQLLQAQKLESLGRLAGGVAHDFNNLLTVINGYSDLMLKDLSREDPLYSGISEIKKAGERAACLTSQLLAFSRKQVIEPRVIKMNDIIADAEKMLRRLIGENIELVTTLDPDVGFVMADPGQMHQVLMNLVVNARDAMPHGGRIEIATGNVHIRRCAPNHRDGRPGDYVRITVSDTGVGMDEQTLQNAFEPFFTTKEFGKGTGLGLSTVHGIVQQSGGWVQVRSAVNEGTAFDIYLPRILAVPVPEKAPPTAAEEARGTQVVLVVEDDEEVRKLTKTILAEDGYFVLDAANGEEALSIERQHAGPIHLLITDVILPGLNGKALSERLRASRPEIKVLFTSGYPADVTSPQGISLRDVPYLPKPFRAESLTEKVHEILAGS